MLNLSGRFWLTAVAFVAVAGCSSSDGGDSTTTAVDAGLTGGSTESGGTSASGGSQASGGSSASGGAQASGGAGATGGTPDGGMPDAGAEPTEAEAAAAACARIEAITCESFERCTGLAAECDGVPRFSAAARIHGQCEGVAKAVGAGFVVYDSAAAERCIAAAEEAASVCSLPLPTATWSRGTYRFGACEGVFVGTAELGEACYDEAFYGTDGCAEGYCKVEDSCPGTCVADVPVGGDCSSASPQCAPGSTCRGGKCVVMSKVGESCLTAPCVPEATCNVREVCQAIAYLNEPCDDMSSLCFRGLVCSPAADGNACERRKSEGEPCDRDEVCFGGFCKDGTCTSQRERGETCFDDDYCPQSDYCKPADDGGAIGTCAARADVGAICTDNRECQDGLLCVYGEVDGTCAVSAKLGDPCQNAFCAEGLWCDFDNNRCEANIAEGGDCDPSIPTECQPGLFCMGDGKCHPYGSKVGDPCGGDIGESCGIETGLFCDRTTQKCVVLAGEAERCNASETSCQTGLWCACGDEACSNDTYDPFMTRPNEACRALLPLGSPCSDWQSCVGEGYCDGTTCVANPTRCTTLP